MSLINTYIWPDFHLNTDHIITVIQSCEMMAEAALLRVPCHAEFIRSGWCMQMRKVISVCRQSRIELLNDKSTWWEQNRQRMGEEECDVRNVLKDVKLHDTAWKCCHSKMWLKEFTVSITEQCETWHCRFEFALSQTGQGVCAAAGKSWVMFGTETMVQTTIHETWTFSVT